MKNEKITKRERKQAMVIPKELEGSEFFREEVSGFIGELASVEDRGEFDEIKKSYDVKVNSFLRNRKNILGSFFSTGFSGKKVSVSPNVETRLCQRIFSWDPSYWNSLSSPSSHDSKIHLMDEKQMDSLIEKEINLENMMDSLNMHVGKKKYVFELIKDYQNLTEKCLDDCSKFVKDK